MRGKGYWIQYYRSGTPYHESTKSKKGLSNTMFAKPLIFLVPEVGIEPT